MKQIHNFITVLPYGYGHNKVTVHTFDSENFSTVTSNTRLTDQYKSDDEDESQHAKEQLIGMVLSKNNIVEYEIVK